MDDILVDYGNARRSRRSLNMDIKMNKKIIGVVLASLLAPSLVFAASPFSAITHEWTYAHAASGVAGLTSEISAYDAVTNSIWVAGVVGVDVLNASNGSLIQHIDTSAYGSINSVAIHNGLAAFAIESSTRTDPGVIKLFDTASRNLASGINSITVGELPDMVTFTKDGSKLLVANEATPTNYSGFDPAGSVSIINMASRSVLANAGFIGVPTTGSNIRNAGMDYEPEYIAVNAAGTKAYVTLQEANAIGVLNLHTNAFSKIIGLGTKDFSVPGNSIDPTDRDYVSGSSGPTKTELRSVNVKGLYQPDGIAVYDVAGKTYLVTANEGDTREDEADKARGSTISGTPNDLKRLNISTVDSTPGNLVTFGTRDFTIRDELGNIVFSSGNELDAKAIALGIYDDTRSDDKGVEPEGVELLTVGSRTFAFIGLERTLKSAVAIYDVTDPSHATFLDMLVTEGDVAPEGLKAFYANGKYYLSIANEVSNTTTLYSFTATAVPEPETYALMLAGVSLIGLVARRNRKKLAS